MALVLGSVGGEPGPYLRPELLGIDHRTEATLPSHPVGWGDQPIGGVTPNRLNHVKMRSPEPAVVDAFLREVCEIPEGWPIGDAQRLRAGAPLGPGGSLAEGTVGDGRGLAGATGFIVGDPSSRQFQVLQGESAVSWAVCISTRDVQGIYDRAQDRGVPCTPISVVDWNPRDDVRFFFCVVGGLMFEVIHVEPK